MLIPVVDIDLPIQLDVISPKFLNILKQMGPFGPENPKPVFEARNVYVFNSLSSFKDRHIKFLVGQDGSSSVFQAVGFDQADYYEQIAQGDAFRMAFTIEENVYNGTTSVQLRIKDIKFE
jgi:single-stranded-DNA-specific exonuclease